MGVLFLVKHMRGSGSFYPYLDCSCVIRDQLSAQTCQQRCFVTPSIPKLAGCTSINYVAIAMWHFVKIADWDPWRARGAAWGSRVGK